MARNEVPAAAIVNRQTWDLLQARLRHNRSAAGGKPGRGGKPRYLLSSLLDCGICGSKFIIMGGSQHRYTCGAVHARHSCSALAG
jgi:hypothetical protein